MKSALPTLALVTGLATAVLAPALLAPDCPAQEKPAEAPKKTVVRMHAIDGIVSPSLPWSPVRPPRGLVPFGWRDPSDEARIAPEARDPGPDWGQITEFVQCLVPPDARDDVEIHPNDARLLVKAPEEIQRAIASALDSLRRALGTPYEVDVRSVVLPDGPEGDALAAELAACAGAVPDALVRRLLAADRGARGGSVAVHGGRASVLEQTRSVPVVTDWGVEIAQTASIADPIPQSLEDGLRAEIVAQGLAGGRAVVSVTAAAGEARLPFRRVEMRTRDLGSAEMPEVRAAFASSAALLAPGETAAVVLVSPTSDGASTRRAVLVRLVASPPAPEFGPADLVPVAGVTGVYAEPRLWFASAVENDEHSTSCVGFRQSREPRTMSGDDLHEVVRKMNWDAFGETQNSVAYAEGWAGGALLVQGDPAWRAAIREAVATVERDVLRGVRLDVRLVVRGADGAERTVGALATPALLGRPLALAAYDVAAYLADYDVEVAQEARIADPRPNSAVGGAVLNALVQRGAPGSLRVDFDLVVSSLGALENAPVGAAEVGTIERIPVRRSGTARTVIVETGKAREIDLGLSPWSPAERGERLFAVVRAELAR